MPMKRSLLFFVVLVLAIATACVGVHEDEPEPVVPVIDPEDGSADIGTRFFHRSLALEFTATWCQYCPNMAEALRTAQGQRPGRLVEIAVHYADDMAAPESATLSSRFSVTSYPTMILDWDSATAFQSPDPAPMVWHVDQRLKQPVSGIAVDASLASAVRISVKAAASGNYRVAAVLVTDGIVAEQAGYGPGFTNNAVLTGFLTDLTGQALGSLEPDAEASREFQLPQPSSGTRIVAWVFREAEGGMLVDNVAQCALGKKIDYRYEAD